MKPTDGDTKPLTGKAGEADTKQQAKKAPAAPKFTVKRHATLPLLKPEINTPIYFQFSEAVKIGKQVEKDKDAAIIANGIDLSTGEPCQFLVPAVMQGILHDDYGAPKFGTINKGDPVSEIEPRDPKQKADAYVGLSFEIIKHEKGQKRYHPMSVTEIEVEA